MVSRGTRKTERLVFRTTVENILRYEALVKRLQHMLGRRLRNRHEELQAILDALEEYLRMMEYRIA